MLLEAKNISYRYSPKDPWILEDVSFCIETGERVALIGSSGCGKSTLAKILSGYIQPSKGEVLLEGAPLPASGFCPVQMIYQHPELAVNPRHRMKKILTECWEPDGELLKAMGIEEEWLSRWPNELSGGELQRFCIARVLGPQTKFLLCDEISTMLDVITQAQIWELVLDCAAKNGLGLIVVTHNEALAQKVCDRTIALPQLNRCQAL
ncbi:ATP-binding cassette domain-containing protein [Oscillospiraceae bacterium MB08-C2-2]|nr:ATP-binding cassette domain-containing protein [Oscillospiraceae bacterium MB08-C2-2]